MKSLIFLIFILIYNIGFCENITCYSNNSIIYNNEIKKIEYTSDYIVFTEKKTNDLIFVFNAECIIKVDHPNKT